MTDTASLFSKEGFLISPETKSDPALDLWVETLAPFEVLLTEFEEVAAPTCRDVFSGWRQDANRNGFSAKMFVHLMLWSSNRDWKCSDTQRLLSEQTPRTLQVCPENVSSWSDSISKEPLIGSSERAITPRAMRGNARQMVKRKSKGYGHHFPALLLDGTEWILATCTFTKARSGGYVACLSMKENGCRDGRLDGLAEYLTRLANELPETE